MVVVGAHHMLLSIHEVLHGATCHATRDVLPLNSVEPLPLPAEVLEQQDRHGGTTGRLGWPMATG